MSDRIITPQDNQRELISIDSLEIDYGHLRRTMEKAVNANGVIPEAITDEATQGIWQDRVTAFDAMAKHIESTRVEAKRPYLTAERTVDGYFQRLLLDISRARGAIASVTDAFLRRKRDEERKRREDEARRLREEQEAKAKAAREAEERARKAEERRRKTESVDAQAKAEANAAEARRLADEAAAAEVAAQAKSADLSRTRSDSGTLGTLGERWNFRITDASKIKGAPIWAFITVAAKEQGIKAYMRANAPKNLAPDASWQPLDGVEFYRESKGQYRR